MVTLRERWDSWRYMRAMKRRIRMYHNAIVVPGAEGRGLSIESREHVLELIRRASAEADNRATGLGEGSSGQVDGVSS